MAPQMAPCIGPHMCSQATGGPACKMILLVPSAGMASSAGTTSISTGSAASRRATASALAAAFAGLSLKRASTSPSAGSASAGGDQSMCVTGTPHLARSTANCSSPMLTTRMGVFSRRDAGGGAMGGEVLSVPRAQTSSVLRAGRSGSGINAVQYQQALGTIVPHIHGDDFALAHHKTIDVAIALERRAVGPFAVEGAQIVDDGFAPARNHVHALHLLFHPLVAALIEDSRLARVGIAAPAGEGDLEVGRDVARRGDGIGHHRGDEE